MGPSKTFPGSHWSRITSSTMKTSTIVMALMLGQGQCIRTERHPAALNNGRRLPLNGSKVHTIQKMIAAGGVKRMSNSGPRVVRKKRTAGFVLPAAQVVNFSVGKGFGKLF